MSEDILHRLSTIQQNANLNFTPEIYSESLVLIVGIYLLIANKVLANLGMPALNRPASGLPNRDATRAIIQYRQLDCICLH